MADLPESTLGERERIYHYPIPVAWSSAMQSESYWHDEVHRLGSTAFRPPKILRAERVNALYGIGPRLFHCRRTLMDEDIAPSLKASYKYTLSQWQRRRLRWDAMRSPWYPLEYRLWSLSPWSWVHARRAISRFKIAHSQKNLLRCLALARALLNPEPHYNETKDTPDDNPILWLFISIGSLMAAAVPALTADLNLVRRAKILECFPNSRYPAPPITVSATGSIRISQERLAALDVVIKTPKTSWIHPNQRIKDFVDVFYPGSKKHPMPKAWLNATMNCGRAIWDRHMSGTRADEWLPFDFDVPDYDTEWARCIDTDHTTNNLKVLGWCPSIAPESDIGRFISPPPSPILEYSELDQLPPQDAPGMVIYRKGRRYDMYTDIDFTRDVDFPKHYTVSEVGNHIFKDSTWVVEPDENLGYDVYRITDLCRKLGYSTARRIRSQLLTVGPYGPMLRINSDEHASKIRAEFGKSLRPIGKLLMYKRYQEIAEYDGKNGMPLWITIGIDVYDVTKFAFKSSQEKSDLTQIHNGKPNKLPDLHEGYEELIHRLLPYRCAFIAAPKSIPRLVLHPLTRKMLSWHDNPSAGCYTAIGNTVYDLTTYLESHPGGKDILIKYLGKEAVEFDNYHTKEILDSYPEFRIGRLVPEIRLDQINKHCVAIHEWLYDISDLAPDKSSDKRHHLVYEKVKSFGGLDASEAIKRDNTTSQALVQLVLEEKDRIVGKVVRTGDDIPKEIPDGELSKHIDPGNLQGAWTVVDGLVYDVSALMRHGAAFYEKTIPALYAGKNLADTELATWLSHIYPNRVIGRLVPGPAWPEHTIGELFNIQENPEQEAREHALRNIEELKKQGRRVPPGMLEAATDTASSKVESVWTRPVPTDIMDWATAERPTPMEFKNNSRERRKKPRENNKAKRKVPSDGERNSVGRNTRKRVKV